MPVQNITLREDKGSALTHQELDNNFKYLRNFSNAMERRLGVSLNTDGTLKAGAVNNLNQIADGLITSIKLAAGDGFQSGDIIAFGGAAKTGWLECDGAAVSRTTYAALFAVIGTAYGIGDNVTTFNLPDCRSRVLIGVGQGPANYRASGNPLLSSYTLGGVGGKETHVLANTELPNVTIAITTNDWTETSPSAMSERILSDSAGSGATSTVNISTGGGGAAHENRQPYIAVKWFIRT